MLNRPLNEGYSSTEDFVRDCELLELSDIFEAEEYRSRAAIGEETRAAEHYLAIGWRLNIEPNPSFDGGFLYPYFCSIGFNGPPAITYIIFRAAGWPTYPTRAQTEAVAAPIRASQLFDEAAYAVRLGNWKLDPVLHYLIVGEQAGMAPSDAFDPMYYRQRYPDIEQAGISPLYHYVIGGQREGRRPISVAASLRFDTSKLDPERDTILLVMHQASRTGAPILAYNIAMRLRKRYNIIGLLLAGGDLVADFERCCAAIVGPLSYADWHPVEAEYLV